MRSRAVSRKILPAMPDHAGVDALRVRQELPTHPRAAPVGGDQHVALGRGAVLEMRDDPPAALLITLEGLAEMQIVDLGEQQLAQGDAAGGAMARDRIGAGDEIAVEGEQRAHLLGEEANRRVGRSAGAVKDLEEMRRQAFMQSAAAGRTDMHPVALQAVGQGAVTLVDCSADPGSFQALRQGEAADAAADNHHVEGFRHLKLL